MSDIFRSADYARETLKKEQETREQTEKKIEKTDDQSTSIGDGNTIEDDDLACDYDDGSLYIWNGPFGFYINYHE